MNAVNARQRRYFIKIKNSSCSCCWLMVQQRFIFSLSIRNAAASPRRTLILTPTNTKSITQTPITIAAQRQQDGGKKTNHTNGQPQHNTANLVRCSTSPYTTQSSVSQHDGTIHSFTHWTKVHYQQFIIITASSHTFTMEWTTTTTSTSTRTLLWSIHGPETMKNVSNAFAHIKIHVFFLSILLPLCSRIQPLQFFHSQRLTFIFLILVFGDNLRLEAFHCHKTKCHWNEQIFHCAPLCSSHIVCRSAIVVNLMGLDRLRCEFSLYRHDCTHTAAEWEPKTNNSQHGKRDGGRERGGGVQLKIPKIPNWITN